MRAVKGKIWIVLFLISSSTDLKYASGDIETRPTSIGGHFESSPEAQTGMTQFTQSADQITQVKVSELEQATGSADQNINIDQPSEDVNNTTVDPDHYSCDVCGEHISTEPGTVCYTCNQCVDFCEKCKEQDRHEIHKEQLHIFSMPPVGESCFCRSCGHVFQRNQNKLYECGRCSDNYILCLKCYKEGIHVKHSQYLERKTKKEYYAL